MSAALLAAVVALPFVAFVTGLAVADRLRRERVIRADALYRAVLEAHGLVSAVSETGWAWHRRAGQARVDYLAMRR